MFFTKYTIKNSVAATNMKTDTKPIILFIGKYDTNFS